ncbi:MAG: hypothetical protein ACUZ8O_14160 [Candidatus Anammoxibacter sp.]
MKKLKTNINNMSPIVYGPEKDISGLIGAVCFVVIVVGAIVGLSL